MSPQENIIMKSLDTVGDPAGKFLYLITIRSRHDEEDWSIVLRANEDEIEKRFYEYQFEYDLKQEGRETWEELINTFESEYYLQINQIGEFA